MFNSLVTSVSVRFFNILTLIIFVAISIGIVLYATFSTHQGALKIQFESIENLIGVAVHEQIRQTHLQALSLVQTISQRKELKKAYKNYLNTGDKKLLEQQLSDPLLNGHNFALSLELFWIRSYDLEYQLVAESSAAKLSEFQELPKTIIKQLSQRQGTQRMQAYGALWHDKMANPFYSVILPIGGLRPQGYIEIVINPLFSLNIIENMLHMPIHISHQDGIVRYKSQQLIDVEKFKPVSYWLKDIDNKDIIKITAYVNIASLESETHKTNLQSVSILLILTTVLLMLAIGLLNHFLFNPLKNMVLKLDEYEKDDSVTIPNKALLELHVLGQAINRLLVRLHDRNQELSKLSLVDGLTGIANRRRFDNYIQQEWQFAIKSKQPISLLLIDIDHFKLYNDHYGHQQGDFCLRQVAQTIQEVVEKDTDLVARYGGEEFAVILPHTTKDGAKQIAERIMKKLQKYCLKHAISPTDPCVTISIGIGGCYPKNVSLDESCLVSCTDNALYRAKELGRNCYYVMGELEQPHNKADARIN